MRKRYCAVCGERLGEGASLCPNCGAEVKTADKKGLSRRGRLAGLCAAAIVLAAFAALAAVLLPDLLRSDSEKFIYYQQRLLAGPLLDALAGGLGEAREGVDLDLTVTAAADDAALGPYLEGSALTLKLRTGAETLVNLDARFMGGDIFASALTLGGGKLGFWLPQAEDVYYTVDISRLPAIISGGGAGGGDLSALDVGRIAGTVGKYLGIAASVINDGNVTSQRGVDVAFTALEGGFTGTVYTFRPTAEDVEAVITDMAAALESDDELADMIAAAASAAGKSLGGMRSRAMLRQLAGVMRGSAGRAGRAVGDAGFQWTLTMEGRRVRRIAITAGDLALVLERAGGKSGAFAAFLERGGAALVSLSGRSAGKGGSYVLDVSGGPELRLLVEERRDGSIDHTFTLPDGAFGLEGALTVTVNASGNGTARMPEAACEDISAYTNEELEALFRRLGMRLMEDLGFAVGDLREIFGGI